MRETPELPEPATPPSSPSNFDDPRVLAALEEYMTALEAGTPLERQAFLARHPDIALALDACLEGVDLVRAGTRQLLPTGAGYPSGPAAQEKLAEVQPEGPLGDFRLVRELGRGGMGVVYEAVQISLGRSVALKVLPFAATLDARQIQRFKHEAQAAAQLHHSNIVPVHAVGCERGVHYYAMQLIDGQSLAAILQDLRKRTGPEAQAAGKGAVATSAPPSPATPPVAALSTQLSARSPAYFRTIASLGVQAALALEYAHQVGVVHRDIKPANLLLDAAGRLWVTDFGLARCQADAGLTRTGDVVGTLRYMSPEQALSQRGLIDHRSDIYSLGVTLYESLTLQPPYPGRDREELLRQLALSDPPVPRRLCPTLPVELETIVLKAMAREPERRYASAQELADDLKCYLENRPIQARRPGMGERAVKWARRHRPIVAAAVIAGLMGVGTLALSTMLIWNEKEQTKAAYAAAKTQAEIAESERQRAAENFEQALRGTMEVLIRLEDWRWDDVPRIGEIRRDLVQRGLQFYEQFLHDDSPDPVIRFQTGRTYRQMATVYSSQQKLNEAYRAMGRAIALFEVLAAADPNEPAYEKEMARTYWLRGSLRTSEGRPTEAAEAYAQTIEHLRRALAHDSTPSFRNEVAWFLATCPATALRQPTEAVGLARQAVELAPQNAAFWNTLGVALYRANQPAEAVQALRKAMDLHKGGDACDWFFLSMSYHQLGDQKQAHAWHQRAAQWVEEHWPPDEDLYRAHIEASQLLGAAGPKVPGSKESDQKAKDTAKSPSG